MINFFIKNKIKICKLKEGHKGKVINWDSKAKIYFECYLLDGTKVNEGEQIIVLKARRIIKGFRLGLLGMEENEERMVTVPADLAYKNNKNLKDETLRNDLKFKVKVLEIYD